MSSCVFSIPKLSKIKSLSIKFPGSILDAITIPITSAIIVVITKYNVAPNPKVRNCSPLPADIRPRIIDAKISGMIIICIIFRNKLAGIANQSVTISTMFFGIIPTSGPKIMPKIKPKTKPAITCAHNLVFIRYVIWGILYSNDFSTIFDILD